MENIKHRISQAQKNKNGKQWYKDVIDSYDKRSFDDNTPFSGYITDHQYSDYYRMRTNYDLYNNIMNPRDFDYITHPWGEEGGELPARLTNRDITSSKIKALLGMEMDRPFNWQVIATNPEATTRKEQEELNLMKQFVISQVMEGIQGEEGEEVKPPEEVKKYMIREHQDPSEVLGNQLLHYLHRKQDLKDKFNRGFKHACISGKEIYWVGEENGEPVVKVVNPMSFDFDRRVDTEFIQDGDWAVAEFRMSPSEIVAIFGDELTDKQIDQIYDYVDHISDEYFDFGYEDTESSDIRVIHVAFKSLRKIGFLDYKDQDGKVQQKIVNSSYRLNKAQGDLKIKWEWIPEVHEGIKILRDIYLRMRPLPNQHKDLDNLYECKLPYVGAVYDGTNSQLTSPVDRIKPYQYFYNIVFYRMELAMAKDKGRKLAVNLNAIPSDTKFGKFALDDFEYFMNADDMVYLNPNEEGNRYNGDVGSLVKAYDLSNGNDITRYANILELLDRRAGESIGLTPELEGRIQERQAVSNVNKTLQLSTNILEPLFSKHDHIKTSVLQTLIEVAKVTYSQGDQKKLAYVLDDFSKHVLSVDQGLLDNSTLGIFVTNSGQLQENKQLLLQHTFSAVQNDTLPSSVIPKILRSESMIEAEEALEVGERSREEREAQAQQAQQQHEQQMLALQEEARQREREHELQKIELQEKLQAQREIQKQIILSLGFAENTGADQPRIAELGKLFLEQAKLDLKREEMEKNEALEKEKIAIQKQKAI